MIILDVDDVLLNWTSGFRKYYNIDVMQQALPYYGWDLNQFNSNVVEFNDSKEFGELTPTSFFEYAVMTWGGSPRSNILMLSSCGSSESIVTNRKQNIDKVLKSFDTPFNYQLVCLDLHQSKRDFFEQHLHEIDVIFDDAYKNCVEAKSLNLSTVQVIPEERVLEDWEMIWYGVNKRSIKNSQIIW